jgi:hypothetical protein
MRVMFGARKMHELLLPGERQLMDDSSRANKRIENFYKPASRVVDRKRMIRLPENPGVSLHMFRTIW